MFSYTNLQLSRKFSFYQSKLIRRTMYGATQESNTHTHLLIVLIKLLTQQYKKREKMIRLNRDDILSYGKIRDEMNYGLGPIL